MLTKIVLAEAEIFKNWQRLAKAEKETPHRRHSSSKFISNGVYVALSSKSNNEYFSKVKYELLI